MPGAEVEPAQVVQVEVGDHAVPGRRAVDRTVVHADQVPVAGQPDVALQRVDPLVDRPQVRAERVLGQRVRGAAVRDDQRRLPHAPTVRCRGLRPDPARGRRRSLPGLRGPTCGAAGGLERRPGRVGDVRARRDRRGAAAPRAGPAVAAALAGRAAAELHAAARALPAGERAADAHPAAPAGRGRVRAAAGGAAARPGHRDRPRPGPGRAGRRRRRGHRRPAPALRRAAAGGGDRDAARRPGLRPRPAAAVVERDRQALRAVPAGGRSAGPPRPRRPSTSGTSGGWSATGAGTRARTCSPT